MAKSRALKLEIKESLKECFAKARASIVTHYSGLSTEDLTKLRVDLHRLGCEFKVVKNRVAKKAIEDGLSTVEPIKDKLKGPVAIAYIHSEDVAAATKAVFAFAKEHEAFKVQEAVMDGQALSLEDLKALSQLPSKQVLLGQLLSSMLSPHRSLLRAFNGLSENLVRVLQRIQEQKS